MNIIKDIDKKAIPVIAWPERLMSMTDYKEHGYLSDKSFILPYYEIKKYKLWTIIKIPCDVIGEGTQAEKLLFLDNAVSFLIKERNPDFILSVNTAPMCLPPTKSYYCKWGTYVLDLSPSAEDLLKGIHSKHRNVIKKAEKDGLEVDKGERYKNDCINLIHETYLRQGSFGLSSEYYSKFSNLGNNAEFWVVKQNDEIQGCAIIVWDNDKAYYMHGGSKQVHHTGALNFLHWNIILSMKSRGVRKYDFVGARINPEPGSKLEGIQRFKSRFGGPMEVGYMWRVVNHSLKYFAYMHCFEFYIFLKTGRLKKAPDPIKEERNRGNF